MKRFIGFSLSLILMLSVFSCDNYEISSGQADSFVKLYGTWSSDKGIDVKTFNNGYIIVATTTVVDNEHTDISIIKTDKFGNQKGDAIIIDGGSNDEAGSLLLTQDGGYIAVGTYTDTIGFYETGKTYTDICAVKYTSNDEQEWIEFYGLNSSTNEVGTTIIKAQTGYIITGCTDRGSDENPAGTKDVYLVKIDDTGNFEWDRSYGAGMVDYAADVLMHSNGYLIVGSSNSFTEEFGLDRFDILLIKTNFDGGETHKFTYGGIYDDYGNAVVETTDGFVLVGSKENINGDDANIYIAKVDKDNLLDIKWNKSFGDNLYDQGFDLIRNENGFTVVGNTEISNGTTAAYFLNIDNEGNELNENILGSFNQSINTVERTSEGGYIMVGNSGQEGNEMICLMKLNYDGEL